MLKRRINKLFKFTMVLTILANTILSYVPVKALTSSVSGNDIIARAQTYSNWGYNQVGTCTGLVTRTLNDLGIASSIVGNMVGNSARFSPAEMYDNALAHPEEAKLIWQGTIQRMQDYSDLFKNGDLVIQLPGDVVPNTGFGHVAFIHRYGSTISMYGANSEATGIGDLPLITNARGSTTVNPFSYIRVFRLVDDTPFGDLKIAKKDEDGVYVPNTSFKISYHSDMSDPIGTYKTGTDGTVTINDLIAQKVYIKEESVPNHLVLDKNIHSINVVKDDTVTYTATNVYKTGSLEIKKVDANTGKTVKKAGNEFDIYKSDDTFVATIATDNTGIARLNNIRYGDYYYLERTPAHSYVLNTERKTFEIKEDKVKIETTYANVPTKGKIDLYKCDTDLPCNIKTGEGLGDSQGAGSIDGAVYGLYAKANILDPADNSVIFKAGSPIKQNGKDVKLVIENGHASVNNLFLGLYMIREEIPGDRYLLDATEYEIDLGYTDPTVTEVTKTVLSHDTVKKQPFKIAKFTSNGKPIVAPALENAEFTYILERYVKEYGSFENAVKEAKKANSNIHASEWGVMVTDDEGVAVSKALPAGKYTVHETKVPNENVTAVNPFTVEITKNDPDTPLPYIYANDTPFETILAIVKQDSDTNRTIALSGTTFKIKCLSDNLEFKEGEYVNWWLKYPAWGHISEFTTGEDGTVTLPYPLSAGQYQLEEVKAPNGYVLAKSSMPFTISNDGFHQQTGPDDTTIVKTVIFKNNPVKGQVKVDKEADLFKGYQSESTEYGELFSPVYEKGLLPNVKFEIKAHTDIVGAEKTTHYRAGKTVEILTTDGENITTSSLLPIGTDGHNIYSIQEISTEDGYVLDDTIRYFRFDYVNDETAVVAPTWLDENGNEIETEEIIQLENDKQAALALTSKQIELSEIEDNTQAYKEVVFGCFANIVDGLEKDSLVGISKVNDDSSVKFSLSQSGEYYVKELATNDNLVMPDTTYPFTFTYQGDKVQQIEVNGGEPVYNYLKRGSVEIRKSDEESGNALINVPFELATDPEMEHVIKTTWTDETGKALFEELEANHTYFIREKYDGNHDMVNKGYVYDPTVYEVTVSEHEEVVTLNLTNKQVKGKVQFTKTGEMFTEVELVEGKFGLEHHPIWKHGNLLGAELTVYAAEDITTWDGQEWFKKDDVVTTLESDWNSVDSLLLPVGKFYAKETKVPHGYISDEAIYEFEITPNGKAEIQLNGITIDNLRSKVNLDFTKTLEKQDAFINENAFKDVVFGLYAREDIYDYMGKVAIENGALIGVSNIDEKGHLTKTFDLPNGTFYYKELQTNSQYLLDTKEYDFEVGYQGADIDEYTIEVNDGNPIENELIRGSIEVFKYTEDEVYYSKAESKLMPSVMLESKQQDNKKNALAGVSFELATDKDFTNIIDVQISGLNGKAVFENLEKGKYFIREKNGLSFYLKSDEIIEVSIENNEQIETVEIKNNLIESYVNIKKVDGNHTERVLPNAEFTMYEDEQCTKVIKKVLSDKDGIAHFNNIQFGKTVYIKETKAPKGYKITDEVIKVSIDENWVLNNQTKTIVVGNTVIPETPNTGSGINSTPYVMLLLLSVGTMMFTATHKKEKHKKA